MMTDNCFVNWQKEKIQRSFFHQTLAAVSVNELIFKKRDKKELFLIDDSKVIEFISCSYLGLDLDQRLIDAASLHLNSCGVTFSASRTRISSVSHMELSNLLNQIFFNNYTVVFQALHLAHQGLIPLLSSGEMPSYPMSGKGVRFILDKTVHASIQINRGTMLQFGTVEMVDFSDLSKVTDVLKKSFLAGYTPIAFADSIGSMGGVIALKELIHLVEQYNAYLYLDDAHGTSVFGEHGCGYVLKQLDYKYHKRLILTASLAKGFGAVGGVIVLPTQEDVNLVKRFCTTYIFGGSPPLSIVDSAIASCKIHLSDEIRILQRKLFENVEYFDTITDWRDKVVNKDLLSPIRGFYVGDEVDAIKKVALLKKLGFLVNAAIYPTVAKGHSIIRVTLSAAHSKEQIKNLCLVVKEILSL